MLPVPLTGQVVLHIRLVGLFQVLPVHEPGAPINRRVTPLALGLRVGQYVARRVMLGRPRDGYITTKETRGKDDQAGGFLMSTRA